MSEFFDIFENPVTLSQACKVLSLPSVFGAGTDFDTYINSRTSMFQSRTECIQKYGFAIPCTEALEALKALSPILEMGAGLGHWSKLLSAMGVDIISVDNYATRYGSICDTFPRTEHVIEMDAVEAVKAYPDRNVLTIWPDYENPMAYDVARHMKPGRLLAYIGEGGGGCTADASFHELLHAFEFLLSVMLPSWDGIHDNMEIYEVKKVSKKVLAQCEKLRD